MLKLIKQFLLGHKNGIKYDTINSLFPVHEPANKTYFTNVTAQLDLDIDLKDLDFIDFDIQRTLPHKLSQNGPCLVVGDLNGDALEDVISR